MAREYGYYICNNRLIILTRSNACNSRNGAQDVAPQILIDDVIPTVKSEARLLVVDWLETVGADVDNVFQELLPVFQAWASIPKVGWHYVGVGDPHIRELLQSNGLWPEEKT